MNYQFFLTSVSVTVHFDELCMVAWDADYRHENMVGGRNLVAAPDVCCACRDLAVILIDGVKLLGNRFHLFGLVCN